MFSLISTLWEKGKAMQEMQSSLKSMHAQVESDEQAMRTMRAENERLLSIVDARAVTHQEPSGQLTQALHTVFLSPAGPLGIC